MSSDVVDLIMADHREVERLFEQLKAQPESRPLLVPVVAALLTAHSRAEEAEVYPAARDEAGETEEVAHSQEEHLQAEMLLRQLAETDPTSDKFDSVLQELVEAVEHHVQEEESTVLPGMRERLDDNRRQQLGQAFASSRADHLTGKVGQLTREEMARQAQNMDMPGASSMSKQELEKELNKQV
jgi:hemerythrin superfamily protein